MKPLLTVIVTHHLDETEPYLKRCLWALGQNHGVDFETILLASSESRPDHPEDVVLIHDRELNTATKKIHAGVEMASDSSQAFLFLSNDVCMTDVALRRLFHASQRLKAIISPASNSQQADIIWLDESLPINMDIKDIGHWATALASGPETPGILVRQPWVPFYCPLIRRDIWDEVGGLDPALDTRHNDQDYCYRAMARGIPTFYHLGAFVLHFGSKTLYKAHTPEEMSAATAHMVHKYNPGRGA